MPLTSSIRWLTSTALACCLAIGAQVTVAQETAPAPATKPSLKERWANRGKDGAADANKATAMAAGAPISGPGSYSFTLEHDGATRKYRVHVPKSYNASRPTPMLVSFHGGGGNMDYQADDQYYGMVSKSEVGGFIAVFPNGYSPFKSGKLASWNAGNCCAGARDKNSDDVGFIREMVARLKGQLNIDPARVFANGMSNGGLFSYRLACEMADTFSAITVVAGSDGTKTCQPVRPVSVLHIHAQDDEVVLINGGSGKKSKAVADFVAVPETISRWVQRNSCQATPKRVLEKPGVHCDAYTGCKGGVEVKLCVTDTGGHSWPGGRKVRTGETGSTAISATDMSWEFFQTHGR